MMGPVGTAVGAIVGGVGSIAYSLYTQLDETANAVKDAENKAKTLALKPEMNSANWANRARAVLSMYEGDSIYGRGINPNSMDATNRAGANEFSLAGVQGSGSNITIIIDGKKAMERKIEESYYKTLIDLGSM